MNKTKYKGVYYDDKHNSYYVNTTFKTKDGHSIKKCKRGFSTAKKANDWKLEFTVEAKNSNTINNKGSLERILINYIEFKKGSLKPTTTKSYYDILKVHFLPNMPDRLENFKIQDIFDLYKYVSELNTKNSTKNRIAFCIRNFLEWLELTEQIDSSFVKKFKVTFVPFGHTPKSTSYLTIEEFSKLIETLDEKEEFYSVLFKLLFFTGGRIGEVLALNFSNIDFENGRVLLENQLLENDKLSSTPPNSIKFRNATIVPYTKTNSIKNVTIPSWLIEDLKSWRKKQTKSDYLFWTIDGIINRSSVRKKLNRHLELAGLHHIRVHDFRHSNTTLLYDSGCDAKYVAQRLGHISEMTSLEVYKHLTKNREQVNDDIIKGFKL